MSDETASSVRDRYRLTGRARPTVAREYGIPAVVCVRDATREITGQLIAIDGTAGTVRMVDDD